MKVKRETRRILQTLFSTWVAISFIVSPVMVSAQQGPNNLDNFLDDEDFEGPPPGAFPPPAQPGANPPAQQGGNNFNRKNFGDVNQDTGGGGGGGGGKGATPTPRRRRNEPPDLRGHRPPSMAEASDKDITNENYPDLIESFDYPNAEITDIVKSISELTGKNFIVDPQVRGKITIIAPSRVTVAEAYKAFLSALAINGLTVVPSGKFWKIKQAQNAIRDNLDTFSGNYSPNTDNMITRIVQLHYISAKEIYNSLGPILNSRLGELRPYEPTNTLIISDYGSNVDRIMKIVKQLDVPGFEEQMEVIRVKYAKAADLAKLVDQIINKGKSTQQGNAFTAGIPRFTPLGGSQSGSNEAYSLIIPDDRTNSLIVVGNTSGIEKIKKLIGKLDFKLRPEDAGGVYVYYVRFGDAEKIATTLSGLAQASAQTQAQPIVPGGSATQPVLKQGVFGGDVKIVADKLTNALVVTAAKSDYEVVRAILGKLDVPRDQVYVEGVIMEMSVANTRQWGISYYNFIGNTVAGRSGFVSDTAPITSVLDPAADRGMVLGFGSADQNGPTITPPGGGTPITIPSLVGFINFLSTIANVNILSTPQIMAMDNEKASIEVGDKVPVQTSTNATQNGVQTGITREDLTIKLEITPHISPGSNTMRLEINQQIQGLSNVTVKATNLAQNAIATNKRFTTTQVLVHDRDTIVLGGLMKDDERVTTTKIPLLGDIPILGWLFKGKQTTKDKLNLLMFLTPKIIRTKEGSSDLVIDKLKDRVNWIQKNVGGEDTQGDFIDSMKVEKNGKIEEIKK